MISSRATLRRGLLERTGAVALSGGKGHRLAESVSGDCVSRPYSQMGKSWHWSPIWTSMVGQRSLKNGHRRLGEEHGLEPQRDERSHLHPVTDWPRHVSFADLNS
jgi:hypothetical protein